MKHKSIFVTAGVCLLVLFVGYGVQKLAFAKFAQETKPRQGGTLHKGGKGAKAWLEPVTDFIDKKPVVAPGPALNQILKWDGAKWIPATDETGTDNNNYVTSASFSGDATKTLTLTRLGLGNLTATFTDNEGSAGVTMGCGTDNYLTKRSGANNLACSQVYDNGTNVLVNTTTPTDPNRFEVTESGSYWSGNFYHTGTGGGAGFSYNTNSGNGLNAFEGITEGSYSGVFGLHIAASAGYGVWGGTNDISMEWGLYTDDYCYANTYFELSDRKLKKDIEPIQNALDKILKLNPVQYKWDREKNPTFGFPDGQRYGLIADELKQVFPELVSDNSIAAPKTLLAQPRQSNEGAEYKFSAVNQTPLISVLIQAIKEQQATIEELVQRVSELENK